MSVKRARSDSEGSASPEHHKRVKANKEDSGKSLADGPDASTGAAHSPESVASGAPAASSALAPEASAKEPQPAAEKPSAKSSEPEQEHAAAAEPQEAKAGEPKDAATSQTAASEPQVSSKENAKDTSAEALPKPEAANTENNNRVGADPLKDTERATVEPGKQESSKPTAAESVANPETTPESKPTFFSSFKSGSGGFSAFTSGVKSFGSVAKTSTDQSNPWAPKPAKAEAADAESKTSEPAPPGLVDLDSVNTSGAFEKPQTTVTGEEEEDTDYSVKARLYAVNLDSEEKSWKERGVGLLKLNSSRADKLKKRLLMRADSVLRVALNIPLIKDTQISKGFQSSLHTEKFLRVASIEDGHAHQFAIKLASEQARDQLYDKIMQALSEL